MQEIATKPPDQLDFTQSQMALIKKTLVPPELSEDQFQLFIQICRHLQLDPFKRQIFALPFRQGKTGDTRLILHTSIEGYRSIANRSGRYKGIAFEKLFVQDTTGKHIIDPSEYDPAEHRLISATVGISIDNFPAPIKATALWESYCPTYDGKPSGLWLKHGMLMLLKCAEALAHRKAGLADYAGVYVSEEIHAIQHEAAPQLPPAQTSTAKQQATPDTPGTISDCWATVVQYLETVATQPDEALAEALHFTEVEFGDLADAKDTPEVRAAFMAFARGKLLNHLRAQGLVPNGKKKQGGKR